jgi:nitrous oxidase accessory protein NosD
LLSSWNNTIERNMIRNNTGGARCGVYIDSSSDLNEIHRNCFFYNGPPQAIDEHSGDSNNWDGNYWEPAPGLSEDPFLIPGAAMQRDNAPLRQCPLCPTQAPVVTPLGLVALIGLLSVIATLTLVRRKRR